MHSTRRIKDDLIYVGGSDRRLSRFENLFPVPRGVSYNSYLLLDEKTVLFDTVDDSIGRQFCENVIYALGGRALDYMVIQHMEPDHCGLIDEMLRRYPNAKVVCSAKALTILGQFYDINTKERALVVAEGDKLCTGSHTLHFMMAPMVHWPEVMVTYDELHNILFSADAFGTFGALAGNVIDDEIDIDSCWIKDVRRYYTNIVGKYGVQVQALMKKAGAHDIEMICPLHGPVWHDKLDLVLEKYQAWSTYQPEGKSVLIVYATMYGNTENAANVLAGKLADLGVRNIAMYDISETDVSELVAESFRCSHLVLASPTYNGGLHPKMEAYLSDVKALGLQGRTVAMLENGTWAPAAVKPMKAMIEGMKNMTIIEDSVALKSTLEDNQLATIDAIAEAIAAGLE